MTICAKVLLDGPKANRRGWYALFDADNDNINVTVWHAKDSPDSSDNRPIELYICDNVDDGLGWLREEGWLSDAKPTFV